MNPSTVSLVLSLVFKENESNAIEPVKPPKMYAAPVESTSIELYAAASVYGTLKFGILVDGAVV